MKKILSVLLTVAMLLSSLALLVGAEIDADGKWTPVNSKWDAISRDGVSARFIIGGDIHFTYYNAQDKLAATYNAAKQIGGVDALMIAGDLTHFGTEALYAELMSTVNEYTSPNNTNPTATGDSVGTTILSMGNHEYWDYVFNKNGTSADHLDERFTECTGYNPCDLYWISGVPVIALSPTSEVPERVPDIEPGNNYDGRLEFLQNAYKTIDDSKYNGPIVIIAHHRTPTDGKANDYYSQEIVDLMKAHPNTVVFTGHSHTWIQNNKEFIIQDAGFTQVRAGSLGNDYGGVGSGFINPTSGKPETPFSLPGDINCSAVLVDVMDDGTVKLRPMDIAKGKYMYDEEFMIDPSSPNYYMHEESGEGTYANGAQKPSFPAGASVTVEDVGNFSSVYVSFSPATPATSLAKDYVTEYRIRFKNTETGAYLKNGSKNYFRVGNYRRDEDNNKDWKVLINGLYWDTNYQVEVRAVTAYGKATEWLACAETVNIGHGVPAYPPIPVVDFDFVDGSIKDQTGDHKLAYTTTYVEDEVNGRKAAKFRAAANTSLAYEFREEDFNRIRNSFTMECYFNLNNTMTEQVIFGGWDAARLGFKVMGNKLHVWANILSLATNNSEDRLVASADIEARTWYHAVAVCDGNSVKLYLNGELVDENTNARGGLDIVPYEPEEDDQSEVVQYFCVGGANPETLTPVYTIGVNSMISKATLYEGYMTADDVKAAYDAVSNPKEVTLPFTDVKAKSWFRDAVKYVYKKGLMNGKEDTKFVPNEATTRAMLVTILYRMEGSPAVTGNHPFTDLKQAWYKDAVAWAYENEIVNGMSETKFDPNGSITRQQMAAILYRYNTYKGYAATERADISSFPDANKVQSYAKDAMAWANAVELITGSEQNGAVYLLPRGNATRAQVATILHRYDLKY